MSHIEKKGGHLHIDGCDAVELAQTYGTPLYVYAEGEIRAQCRAVHSEFLDRWENTRAAYAAKAFCTQAMLRLAEQEGMCVDVVSGGELYTAIRAGFPPERIEFNGNNKLKEELELAVDYGIGRVIIDGLAELALLEEICAAKGRTMQVLYRITPNVDAHTHSHISTGKKDSKFGIPLDEDVIFPAVAAALSAKRVTFLGFHFHVGSQLHDNSTHLEALETMLDLSGQVHRRYGFAVKELNIGGGFSARYLPGEERRPYAHFLTPVMERVEDFFQSLGLPRPAVVIEPGRSIVAEAGITLYRAGSRKEIKGVRKYVAVDGGMPDNIRPALYGAQYTAAVANRMDETARETVTLCGKCCESGDILIHDASLPPVETGDVVAVFTTGAYGYSMANNYNRLPRPAVVLARGGQHRLIVARETYDDMLKNECIPEDL